METLDEIIKSNNISKEDMELVKKTLNLIDLSDANKLRALVEYVYNVEDIFKPRERKSTNGKFVFIYLLNTIYGMSYKDIAINYKTDKTAVGNAVNKIKIDIQKDFILRQKIKLIKDILQYDNYND